MATTEALSAGADSSAAHLPPLKTFRRLSLAALLGAVALSGTARGQAIVNVALGKPVSGTYYDSGSEVFPATNVTDGRFGDTGEPYSWSFWLSPQGTVNGVVTVDLLGQYSLSSFVLQNSHNRGFYDRGTNDFILRISSDGVNFTTFFTGAFTSTEWTELTLRTISLNEPVVGQYLQFQSLSLYGGQSAGLNELQAFGVAVPEPSTWILLAGGAAALGLIGSQRRRTLTG
jgi:hypothetical protein